MKARTGGERKDIKPITGMFELLQEEGLTTKKEGGLTHAHGHTDTHRGLAPVSSLHPEANCASLPSWEDPHTEHFMPEDYVTRRKRRTTASLNDNDPVVCAFALDDKSAQVCELTTFDSE